MNEPINFLNVNIEGDRHLSQIEKLLDHMVPDIVCFQEVLESDIPLLTKVGYAYHFAPMRSYYVPETNTFTTKGLLSMWNERFTLINQHVHPYFTVAGAFEDKKDQRAPNDGNRLLLVIELSDADRVYRIGNTHFFWTAEGSVTDEQLAVLDVLFEALDTYNDKIGIVFSGDFNAPRGRETWERIAARYKDNIPPQIVTTIDQELHKKKGLMYVVDGAFSSPEYIVSDVEVIEGVSDHKAVFARIALT